MHRESDQHGPRTDDELKKEMREVVRGTSPTPAEDWLDPEPPDDGETSPD